MAHNAEAEACDLLMEIENVNLLIDYVEKDTYARVCLYLLLLNDMDLMQEVFYGCKDK